MSGSGSIHDPLAAETPPVHVFVHTVTGEMSHRTVPEEVVVRVPPNDLNICPVGLMDLHVRTTDAAVYIQD